MRLSLTPNAHKQYLKVPPRERLKIKRKLHALEQDPFLGKLLTGELAHRYSLKAWPYHILYVVNKSRKEIWILSILHRQGAYQ